MRLEYETVREYQNGGYTITVRVPQMTEAEKIKADTNMLTRLSSVVQSFQIDKPES